MLHFGQGKWYPGEPLPRWALSCYWRPDGVAGVAATRSLIALSTAGKGVHGDTDASAAFARDLRGRISVCIPDYAMPAYRKRLAHRQG